MLAGQGYLPEAPCRAAACMQNKIWVNPHLAEWPCWLSCKIVGGFFGGFFSLNALFQLLLNEFLSGTSVFLCESGVPLNTSVVCFTIPLGLPQPGRLGVCLVFISDCDLEVGPSAQVLQGACASSHSLRMIHVMLSSPLQEAVTACGSQCLDGCLWGGKDTFS